MEGMLLFLLDSRISQKLERRNCSPNGDSTSSRCGRSRSGRAAPIRRSISTSRTRSRCCTTSPCRRSKSCAGGSRACANVKRTRRSGCVVRELDPVHLEVCHGGPVRRPADQLDEYLRRHARYAGKD